MNKKIIKLIPMLGPGWIVMMADMDAPSAITAIQSGAQFQGHLIIFLIILIFPLFLVQDTASRVGAVTGKTLGKIATENFGHAWTVFAVSGSAIIDFAAYVGEFAGIAVAGLILGIPVIYTVLAILALHTIIALAGLYKKIEAFLVGLGMLLFLFVIIDFFIHPGNVSIGNFSPFIGKPSFLYLIAANIGAVIMPWMLFFHQAADVDRGLTMNEMKRESKGSLIGAVVSEILMISIVIFSWKLAKDEMIDGSSVQAVASSLGQLIGPIGPIIFAVALGTAGLLAMFVISMSMSYSISDALKIKGSFNVKPMKGKLFYVIYFTEIIPAGILTLLYSNMINLALTVMVLSSMALVLPLLTVIRVASNKEIMGKHVISRVRTVSLYVIMILSFAAGLISIITG